MCSLAEDMQKLRARSSRKAMHGILEVARNSLSGPVGFAIAWLPPSRASSEAGFALEEADLKGSGNDNG